MKLKKISIKECVIGPINNSIIKNDTLAGFIKN